jgi:DNA polymerase I-like protein with 3'-5' exonuclease and polymerase domains
MMNLMMKETSDNKYLIIDIETNGLLNTLDKSKEVSKLYCIVTKDIETGEIVTYTKEECYTKFKPSSNTIFIGHNILSYDLRVLAKLIGYKHPASKCIDTLILSQLFNPIREKGNSLAAWGERLGFPKMPSPNFEYYTEEMLEYCINDVELTEKLYYHLMTNEKQKFSLDSIRREHVFRYYMDQQERHGFYFNLPFATKFLAQLTDESIAIEHKLQEIFPPEIIQMKTKTKEKPFNPASRKQIAERLMEKGWKPTLKTEKGNIIVNEDVLAKIEGIPESESILKYLLLQKRASQVKSWIKFCNPNTFRVHGRIKTLGTVSTRCSHLDPNIAQTPATYSPYGEECRTCWTVPDENDYTLLGCDASQLELRVLAHYMKDKKYIHQILHGDIHTTNQQMAGLETRDQAKTFIYALIYGAGAAKIGYIMNKSAKHGQATKNKFLQNVPALNGLLESVHSAAERTGKVRGLDGRYFHVRSLHSSLNVLIQGGGAIICKEWLIQIMKEIITEKIDAKPVANIHDEIQFEVRKENAEKLGEITKTCMKRVEKILGLDCPLDSEYKIGTTWAMTH